jgi:two-component system phosphate regulon sensor histidine kinase PhoR
MFRRRANLGLSRKIVSYYLFFCLVAVCWLAAGVIVTSHAVLTRRAANYCLTRLGSAAATLEMQYLRHDAAGRERMLAEIRGACRAESCSVVADDGKIVAHTSPDLVGRLAEKHDGSRVQWGEVTRVDFVDADGRALHEYRTSLIAGGRRMGELRLALEQQNLWSTIQATAHLAPLAILAPLAFVGAGAWLLRRLARPVAEVEMNLHRIARLPWDADVEVAPLPARDAVSLGWNRLVDRLHALERQASHGSLDAVLDAAARSRNDARFEEVLQRLSDGVAVTDAAGRIEFANQAVAALLGHDDEAAALAGASLEERLLQAADEAKRQEMLSPAARRRTAVCELVQQSGDAERVLRVARLPLGGDAARGHVWSLRDVTQQKLAEQTRDRFIDTATHELRTPLANIKAYAETLATSDYIDVELQKEFCNIINSEVTRLARFIDDLLSISSMEVGALTVDRQKVETDRLFAEVLSKVEPLMQKKSIEFNVSLPPKMPELQLDKDKMIAVVVNVLGNAAKYTPEGGRVSLKVKAEDGSLRIAVEDTGVGIAAEELPKVFEKFFRSDDPRVQAETGSGLGLSLAREVVRMHGGEITVESVLNQGSTFTVLLPLA